MRAQPGQVWEFVHGAEDSDAKTIFMTALYIGEWVGVDGGSSVVVLDVSSSSDWSSGWLKNETTINLPWYMDDDDDSDIGAKRTHRKSWWRRVT